MQVKAGENGYICKIKGIPRDLEGAVQFIESGDRKGFINWVEQTYGYSPITAWEFINYIEYNDGVIPTEWNPSMVHPNDPYYPKYLERLAEEQYQEEHKVRCPYCRSDQVVRERWSEKIEFGIVSGFVKKQWKCTNCQSEF